MGEGRADPEAGLGGSEAAAVTANAGVDGVEATSQERGSSSSSRRDEWLEGDEETADARCCSSSLGVASELGGKPNGQVSAHQLKKDFKERKTVSSATRS